MRMPATAEVAALGSSVPVRAGHPGGARPASLAVLAETLLGLPWLVRLRWGAVAGQVIALLTARLVLRVDLPWLVMGTIIALTAASNVVLSRMPPATRPKRLIPIVLVGDALGLTAMLFVSGGPANPFSVFFLVHVSLASLLLQERAAWGLVGLTVLAFGSLFLWPARGHHAHMHGAVGTMHLVGMWVSYALTASFVAYFIGKVSQSLRDRERHLAAVEHLALQNERLTTLTSFSANAAHELATPLATIGLAAKELSSQVALSGAPPRRFFRTRRSSAPRSRDAERSSPISWRGRASPSARCLRGTTPTDIVRQVDRSLSREHAARLAIRFEDDTAATAAVVVPRDTLAQMLTNLVKNAAEAHDERGVDTPVELTVAVGRWLEFHVLDRGAGMNGSVEQRLGQPFIATKGPAGGLGLGVSLARRFAERLGGQLPHSSRSGGGVDAELALPLDTIGSHP